MAATINGTAAKTGKSASGATFTANLPSSIAVGELVCVSWHTTESNRYLEASGWSVIATSHSGDLETASGLAYRVADGSEGATQIFTYTSGGSASASSVAFRASVDTADPFNGSNYTGGQVGVIDPFVLAANTLTGVAADSIIVLGFGCEATRTVASGDSDLTLIGNETSSNLVQHVYYEANPGSGNAAYSIDMSDARGYGWMLFEFKAAAGGGGGSTQPPRSMHQYRMRRA